MRSSPLNEKPRDVVHVRLNSMLPDFIIASPVTRGLNNSIADQMGDLQEVTNETFCQFFIDTATWGLAYWEQFIGIQSDLSKPLDQRRSVVKSKLRGVGTVNVELIKNVAESYEYGEVAVKEDFSTNTIQIEFIGKYGKPTNMEDLMKAMREIIPAHLNIGYRFRFVTHAELKSKTHAYLTKFTHNQIREGAIKNAKSNSKFRTTKTD
ncbi:putative phage tail protein [Paenibacillus sp. KN14-4R]|uniref:putative phage tail protein n=1 Tax=Paenibacillus sp. KN14-4R TaxID=3445773 RepID=UPI003FA18D22